jgi:hypothetical protein
MGPDLLFRQKGHLSDFLAQRRSNLRKEIESYEKNYVLSASEEDLCQYLISKYVLEAPKIHEDKMYVYDSADVDIDVSRDPRRAIFGRTRPSYVKGTKITIAIPFEGDGDLFHYRPSTFTYSPPRGEIVGQEVRLVYETVEHDPVKFKREHEREVNEIKRYLDWVKSEVQNFSNQLESFVRDNIAKRKKKLMDDLGLVAALGIPIMQRRDLPSTYTIPSIRKKPKIEMPKVSKEPFKPEPTLSEEDYENILEMIYNMALVMERSPQTFSKLKEEEIRNHFLMVLNSNYEGRATGETFNYGGKTDILIREQGKNVFIAECKFWRGERSLLKTIDQLLGYISWRDTKTAILLFNKNQDFTSVLGKVDASVQSHSCYKRKYTLKSAKLKNETTLSYVFHQPRDTNREMVLTVMAFDIPR